MLRVILFQLCINIVSVVPPAVLPLNKGLTPVSAHTCMHIGTTVFVRKQRKFN